MIVTCPSCEARYKINASKIKGRGAKITCPKCKHRFVVYRDEDAEEPEAGHLVQLRVFARLSVEQAADLLGMSRATAYRLWTYARAWLRSELRDEVE